MGTCPSSNGPRRKTTTSAWITSACASRANALTTPSSTSRPPSPGDLLLAALGAGAAAVVAIAPGVDPQVAQARRMLAMRVHVALFLPLPVLIALHVLSAYYF